jgi:hypothetical protein
VPGEELDLHLLASVLDDLDGGAGLDGKLLVSRLRLGGERDDPGVARAARRWWRRARSDARRRMERVRDGVALRVRRLLRRIRGLRDIGASSVRLRRGILFARDRRPAVRDVRELVREEPVALFRAGLELAPPK